MARKRKSGFASVLSSLPPDLKLAFSAKPETTTEETVPHKSGLNESDDLIVQRVYVAQTTGRDEVAPDIVLEELESPTRLVDSSPPPKRQKTSEFGRLSVFSVQGEANTTPAETLGEQMRAAAPYYKSQKSVPQHLKKYFYQRHRYFSLYDEGCLLDEEGWYSVTPEKIANQIAERCRCDTIIDAFCGVGGNAIAFAQTCERVIALDISPVRLAIARHNATIYGVADRIEFILCDYVCFANSMLSLPEAQQRRIDVVFLSPPWGGPSYISGPTHADGADTVAGDTQSSVYSLKTLMPLPGPELFALSHKISRNVSMFLPRNTDVGEIASLAPQGENVEIEEEWMGTKLKALTCYFGGLARGQAHLF